MSQEDAQMVILRTGEKVPEVTAKTILVHLTTLCDNPRCPTALYELVMACRDSTHIPFGKPTREILEEFGLVEDIEPSGHVQIHNDIRNIVLAATEEDGGRVRLVSPYTY